VRSGAPAEPLQHEALDPSLGIEVLTGTSFEDVESAYERRASGRDGMMPFVNGVLTGLSAWPG
jgi:hypothetical protein